MKHLAFNVLLSGILAIPCAASALEFGNPTTSSSKAASQGGIGPRPIKHLATYDDLKDTLVMNRARSGITSNNGEWNILVTDKDLEGKTLRKGARNGGANGVPPPQVLVPKGPPVRQINRVVDIKRPLVFRADPRAGETIDILPIEKAKLGPDPYAQPKITPLGVIRLRPTDNPTEINSTVRIRDLVVLSAPGQGKKAAVPSSTFTEWNKGDQ